MQRKYCCPDNSNMTYMTIQYYRKWACSMRAEKLRRPLQRFFTSGPLEFVVMEILVPLLKTISRKRIVLVLMDRYKKLIRAFTDV